MLQKIALFSSLVRWENEEKPLACIPHTGMSSLCNVCTQESFPTDSLPIFHLSWCLLSLTHRPTDNDYIPLIRLCARDLWETNMHNFTKHLYDVQMERKVILKRPFCPSLAASGLPEALREQGRAGLCERVDGEKARSSKYLLFSG